MIVKEREEPRIIQKLKALIRRLPPDHQKFKLIQESLSRYSAGYAGECSVDFPLSLLPLNKYFILHHLRLPINGEYFQIDTLLLSQKSFTILEVKNLAGELFFDTEFNQLIQKLDGVEKVLPDPITQVERHELQLSRYLAQIGAPEVPIIPLVVLTNQSAIIRSTPNNKAAQQKVTRNDSLPFKILKYDTFYKKEILVDKDIKKIIKRLIKDDEVLDTPVLEKYKISKSEIITGVICEKCGSVPMKREYGTWMCSKCNFKNKLAHVEALNDYRLLCGQTITSPQAREFLHMTSNHLATRILCAMPHTAVGITKGKVYTLL